MFFFSPQGLSMCMTAADDPVRRAFRPQDVLLHAVYPLCGLEHTHTSLPCFYERKILPQQQLIAFYKAGQSSLRLPVCSRLTSCSSECDTRGVAPVAPGEGISWHINVKDDRRVH